jgi:hypothetical protein
VQEGEKMVEAKEKLEISRLKKERSRLMFVDSETNFCLKKRGKSGRPTKKKIQLNPKKLVTKPRVDSEIKGFASNECSNRV